jgi:lipoate---protein ligase
VFVTRQVVRPAVVLGSNQDAEVVNRKRAAEAGAEVVRRRSGGGAVWLEPDEPLWVDVWLPRADHLWDDDVSRSSTWVGEWWLRALVESPLLERSGGLGIHRGAPVRTALSDLVCFAGIVAGEVGVGGGAEPLRKLVGLAQWRGREGALFHCAAYRHWDPAALLAVLDVPVGARAAAELATAAAGLADLAPEADGSDRSTLVRALTAALPDDAPWEIRQGA